MSADTLLVILLVWAVAGLFAAIAFGKAIRDTGAPQDESELIPHAAGALKYFRHNKRKSDSRQPNAGQARNVATKRATG